MDKFAISVQLEAKPGREREVEEFLRSAMPLVEAEARTTNWYALRIGPSHFAIFDTFADQAGRDAHLSGDVAKALYARAAELFAEPPKVDLLEILAVKTSERRTRARA